MRRLAFALVLLAASPAYAMDPDAAEAQAKQALASGDYAFCKRPPSPLPPHARELCKVADEIPDCAAFVQACKGTHEPSFDLDFGGFSGFLGALARAFIWIIIAAVVVLLLVPIAQALLRAQRNKRASDAVPGKPAAPAEEAPIVDTLASDAERLLAQAEQALAQGQLDRALYLFLHAALRALDERGAVRIERHKTHGEYVRECKDPKAKTPLRDLVREVDRVKWGGARVDALAVGRAKERSVALVRALLVALAVLVLPGCGAMKKYTRGADPSEDGLFLDLMKRQGVTITRPQGALATLPLPREDEPPPPVLVIDAERVPLSDESRAHVLRWVEAGGTLVLAGEIASWPKDLGVKETHGSAFVARVHDLRNAHAQDEAHLARSTGLTWPYAEGDTIARLEDDRVYAAIHHQGAGIILGIANDDLFTNAGLARPGNPRALVRLLANLRRDAFQVARVEDGITPPASPIAALVDAGLGKGLLHAVFAVLLTFVAWGARQGRPRPTPPPARRAFAEHVEATGALYARTRLAAHALAAYARYADARLRAAMPRGTADPAAFLAQRTGENPAFCADLWARATAAAHGQPAGPTPLVTLKDLARVVSAAVRR